MNGARSRVCVCVYAMRETFARARPCVRPAAEWRLAGVGGGGWRAGGGDVCCCLRVYRTSCTKSGVSRRAGGCTFAARRRRRAASRAAPPAYKQGRARPWPSRQTLVAKRARRRSAFRHAQVARVATPFLFSLHGCSKPFRNRVQVHTTEYISRASEKTKNSRLKIRK